MTTIYNRITKRRIYGVRWARRGRYWYKPGGRAKYYPRNGWSSSGGGYGRRRSSYRRRSYRRW